MVPAGDEDKIVPAGDGARGGIGLPRTKLLFSVVMVDCGGAVARIGAVFRMPRGPRFVTVVGPVKAK